MPQTLSEHLAGGATQLCHCWRISRSDGVTQGFTDHDGPLSFDGTEFEAESGITASAMQTTTGLAADNGEIAGALKSSAISEEDLRAGVYDDASLEIWQVHWPDPSLRQLRFRGRLGEITMSADAFSVELRGLSDLLSRPFGRVIQSGCSAVLGDSACGVNLNAPENVAELTVETVTESRLLALTGSGGVQNGRFERGRIVVLNGGAAGRSGLIKRHEIVDGKTRLELWEPMRKAPQLGDRVKCFAGCDKTAAMCKGRFGNFVNFQGFPHVPGDDWLMAYPRSSDSHSGGSLVG
ncbi:MAG: DUF2163 domain-containing protein [Pseudomonadota bacterium]